MDYKKLANLLYPNVKNTIEYYEKLFPKRDLKENAEVTRVAPSPTGFLHFGTLYQALMDQRIAYDSDGVYFMRLEDTDSKREIKDAGSIAHDMLVWAGVENKEGYMGDNSKEVGNYGSYVQSKRTEIYNTFAKYLVENGKAFPCFCEKTEGKEDVLERREQQLEANDDIEQLDVCRNLSYEEIENNISKNMPFALRFKTNGNPNKTITIIDRVKGKREIRENAKDFVLIKSNGIPVYAFAHAVDDHLMRVTTVIRGEEWWPSVASHIQLFDAFGFDKINYAHMPVICKLDAQTGNKRKLSKRKDKEADLRYMLEEGYPKESVQEYVYNLLNSNFEEWRIKNPDASVLEFKVTFENVTPNNPMFDFSKLNDISKNVISRFKAEKVYDDVLTWSKLYNEKLYSYLNDNKDYAIKCFSIDRYNAKPRKDLAKWSDIVSCLGFLFKPYFNCNSLNDYELDNVDLVNLKSTLNGYAEIITQYADKQVWFDSIKEYGGSVGFATDNKLYKQNPSNYKGNIATICEFVRIALTGKKNSPDLYDIICVLGLDEVKNRILKLAKLC